MKDALLHTPWLSLAAAATLPFSVLMYVLLDGTDLGVGVLLAGEPDAGRRETMIDSILPVWDGNETWIVLGGGGMLALFPGVYGALLTALYPVCFAMLFALIVRGVAIACRGMAGRRAAAWCDALLLAGSAVAAFSQGVLIGALVQGVRTRGGVFVGSPWDWASGFSLFCGLALVTGYAWLGACWLIWRTVGSQQQRARRWSIGLGAGTALGTALVSIWTLRLDGRYADRWLVESGPGAIACATAIFAALGVVFAVAIARRRGVAPLVAALLWFSFALACVVWTVFPLLLPPSVTIEAGSAPPRTQAFVMAGASVLVPAVLIYSTFAFRVFRGKILPPGAPRG
ncbi:MAG: cytochrome d ubiquinol oxidase subunit II [Burkholderia sp.]